MTKLAPPARLFKEILHTQLLPWANSGSPLCLLDAPPHGIGIGKMQEKAMPLLPDTHGGGRRMRAQHWQESNLNAISVPILGCIVEGEADISVGVTTSMAKQGGLKGQRWTIAMPKKTFFIARPGVPFSAGGQVHWERPHPEKAYSYIVWLKVHDLGAIVHLSTSQNNKLYEHPRVYILNKSLLALSQTIIHELTDQAPGYVAISYLNLTLLLQYILRSLTDQRSSTILPIRGWEIFGEAPHSTNTVVETAIDYINDNLQSPALTAQQIADYVRLSPVHLSRLFHEAQNVPLMKFVAGQRMQLARYLLLHSTYPVNEIATYCGYKYAASFINAFHAWHGIYPIEFRKKNANDRFD